MPREISAEAIVIALHVEEANSAGTRGEETQKTGHGNTEFQLNAPGLRQQVHPNEVFPITTAAVMKEKSAKKRSQGSTRSRTRTASSSHDFERLYSTFPIEVVSEFQAFATISLIIEGGIQGLAMQYPATAVNASWIGLRTRKRSIRESRYSGDPDGTLAFFVKLLCPDGKIADLVDFAIGCVEAVKVQRPGGWHSYRTTFVELCCMDDRIPTLYEPFVYRTNTAYKLLIVKDLAPQ